MAMLLKSDGKIERVTPADGVAFTLDELQGYVEGYIEALPIEHWPKADDPDKNERRIMVFNEDGKRKCAGRHNAAATIIYNAQGRWAPDVIVGNALVGTRKEMGEDDS